MARGGIDKTIVHKARQSIIARGEHPSIDAVRVELGNTGSKTTIHRYLREIDSADPRPQGSTERLSEELSTLVSRLLARLVEEGGQAVVLAQAEFDAQRQALEARLAATQRELATLQRQYDSQHVALQAQTSELHTCHSSLQTEITRNARLSQHCADLEVRVLDKDEQIRSLEEKHVHARDALQHYRDAVEEQRDQEAHRHEGQLQQLQLELRELQQAQTIKQDELTRLNRDNERLLSEARQQAEASRAQGKHVDSLSTQVQKLTLSEAKASAIIEHHKDQAVQLREEIKALTLAAALATHREVDLARRLDEVQSQLARTLDETGEGAVGDEPAA
ncbi:DNA-binding protein [Pseudomonas sp. NFR16]|uniref:DNA-binding protein n=1 Tax=Pseudomonas sp. NFR16 TaxID=1566248 RepID=UPI0008D75AD7|nr:DNA-binding protein [Pseudomonas sp. NFR16]SEI54690.1 replication region DNA-binding N-term [Pseudomonas sp. NFR16]